MSLTHANVAAFRMARHHLIQPSRADLVSVASDICGAQAQVLSAGEHSLAVRSTTLTRAEIHEALWKSRTLMRAFAQRQTLHLIPSAEFPIYIAALQRSRLAAVVRVMARCGVTAKGCDSITESVLEELSAGPLTRQELTERVKTKARGNARKWMDLVWTVARPAFVQGLVCYSPPRGAEAMYVRTDEWLPGLKAAEESEAKRIVAQRFFRAYGPARLQDLAKWSGWGVPEARAAVDAIRDQLTEVVVDGKKALILAEDQQELEAARLKQDVVRLLPGFETYLLAHAGKDHLIAAAHYKKVYRPQGWISATVLLNGRVAGVWTAEQRGSKLNIKIEAFEKLPRALRPQLEEQARRVGMFLEAEVAVV